MEIYEATEQAYKNGYAKGYADAKAEFDKARRDRAFEIIEGVDQFSLYSDHFIKWVKEEVCRGYE